MGARYYKKRRKLKTGTYVYVSFDLGETWIATGIVDVDNDTDRKVDDWVDNYLASNAPAEEITVRECFSGLFDDDGWWVRHNLEHGTHWGPGDLKRKRTHLGLLIRHFGNRTVVSIGPKEINRVLVNMDRGWETKNKILSNWRIAFDAAVEEEIIPHNPLRLVKSFKGKRYDRAIFSEEELRKMFPDSLDTLRLIWGSIEWALYFYLQASCSLRPNEVQAIHWDQWFPEYKGLWISHSIVAETGERKQGTKTDKPHLDELTIKAVPVDEKATMMITALQVARVADEERMFTMSVGRQYVTHNGANKHLYSTLKRLGIAVRGRSQYSFRHTFVTIANRKLSLEEVNQFTGHRSEAMNRRYDHATVGALFEQNAPAYERIRSSLPF